MASPAAAPSVSFQPASQFLTSIDPAHRHRNKPLSLSDVGAPASNPAPPANPAARSAGAIGSLLDVTA